MVRRGAAITLLMLSGCGPAETPASTTATSTLADCPTGSPLPITGLCSDGSATLFVAIDPSIETFAPRCVWRTEEVSLSPTEALVFRAQNCSGEGWDQVLYSHVSGYLKVRQSSLPEDQSGFALQIVLLAAGQTAEQAAMQTLDKALGDQRSRCEIRPVTARKLAGRTFELAPNAELETELNAANPDEPWDACGPNGVTMDGVQFWEGREHRALFHMLGQDTPPWDPASFTFYRKGDNGVWSKTN